jgi:hypothetical protein
MHAVNAACFLMALITPVDTGGNYRKPKQGLRPNQNAFEVPAQTLCELSECKREPHPGVVMTMLGAVSLFPYLLTEWVAIGYQKISLCFLEMPWRFYCISVLSNQPAAVGIPSSAAS